MKEFFRKIIEIYKPFKKVVAVVFFFMICSQVLVLVSPYIYGKIIDGIISGAEMKKIVALALVTLAVYILNSIIGYFQGRCEIKHLDFDVQQHVSKKTLEKIFSFSVGQHNNQNSGVKQSVINKGEHSLTTFAYTVLYDVFPIFIGIVVTISALFYLSLVLGAVTLIGVGCFVGISIYLNRNIKDELKNIEDMSHDNEKVRSEILRNLELVQINAQEKKVTNEYDKGLKKIASFGKKMWTRFMLFVCLRNLIIGITRFLVIVIGAYYVYEGVYTAGYLVVFLSWSSNAFGKLNSIGQLHRRCMELYISIKKYFVMLDIESEVKVMQNPVRVDNLNGRIEFKNVSFKYPVRSYLEDDEVKPLSQNDHEALSDISFTIQSGQRVAFVGQSGAGKSTLTHLILRSYDPDDGQIVIDENDLRILDLKHYRESIGLVEQSVALFDETLRYNIVFGLNGRGIDVTNDELSEVASMSCIDKFYDRLEYGFDTVIGEKGVKLSGGERQRVGIARALIKTPKILIFDEATSSLDTENEALIKESIENASKGRTTIIIAHRLSTIKDVDKIFVMEKGKIVGKGKHKELLGTCEVYKNLVSNQVTTI
ncbi:ABC transporter ATP-binding protein [Candidatus Woesearchaeota archaeon]|jgi:ATP-binding cassette, subfamily B, bacterial|nr:ABC transporter ATP-binding protein [Candidatus Woesearchaeota archaeon]